MTILPNHSIVHNIFVQVQQTLQVQAGLLITLFFAYLYHLTPANRYQEEKKQESQSEGSTKPK
jgi:hypothetical protein